MPSISAPIAPLARLIDRLPSPSLRVQRALAIVVLIGQALVATTGSVVRVTGSGLGCPTWPDCAPGSLVPIANPTLGQVHQWIEFSNRLLGDVLGVCCGLLFLAAVLSRPRRRRYLWLAATMPLGFVLQAVVGGITVLAGLAWWTVSLHFLVSPLLVWLAVLVLRAVDEGDEPARPLIPQALRWLLVAQTGVLIALLIAGTLVTAAGPHSGDARTPRLQVPVSTLAQLHADLMFTFLGSVAAFGFALRITGASKPLWRRYFWLVGLVVAQGALGITQYFLGVPEVLVSLHVLGAICVVIATATLWAASRDRGERPTTSAQPVVEDRAPEYTGG